MKLLITDLDNTLYDWVDFFSRSFRQMLNRLSALLEIDQGTLCAEFKKIHQHYGTTEQPFAALRLPSVRRAFPGNSTTQLYLKLKTAFRAFNNSRTTHLKLYKTVRRTLRTLAAHNTRIVASTDATVLTAYHRIQLLGIDTYLHHLYCRKGKRTRHPIRWRERLHRPPRGYVTYHDEDRRKPEPEILLSVCKHEGIAPQDSIYVGDSIARDIVMAKRAHITSVLAEYGRCQSNADWDLLVSVSHWTKKDIKREARLQADAHKAQPEYRITTFSEILGVVQ